MKTLVLQPAVAAGTDITTNPGFLMGDCRECSIAAIFTAGAGDIVGTFKLQHSINGTTWVDLASQSVSVTASANCILSVAPGSAAPASCAPWLRFHWDWTSGTGNIAVTAVIKEVAAK